MAGNRLLGVVTPKKMYFPFLTIKRAPFLRAPFFLKEKECIFDFSK